VPPGGCGVSAWLAAWPYTDCRHAPPPPPLPSVSLSLSDSPDGGPPLLYLRLENFPGGPPAFEKLARHCYGQPLSTTDGSVVTLLCGACVLQVRTLAPHARPRDPASAAGVTGPAPLQLLIGVEAREPRGAAHGGRAYLQRM
jgi:hypothetical protein